jgi:hypothetical protein
VPGRASGPSRSSGRRWRRIAMCSGNLIGSLGFSRRGVYIGERELSEEEPGPLTRARRSQGVGRAAPVCVGAWWLPSVSSSDVWELPDEI